MPFYKVTWSTYVEAEDEEAAEKDVLDAFDQRDCDYDECTEAEAVEKAPWLRA